MFKRKTRWTECVYCGHEARQKDHVRARNRGGLDIESNIVDSCGPCNCSKGSKLLTEWDPARVARGVQADSRVADEWAALVELQRTVPLVDKPASGKRQPAWSRGPSDLILPSGRLNMKAHVLTAMAIGQAKWIKEMMTDDRCPHEPGTPFHPGDPTGFVLAWLWSQDANDALRFLIKLVLFISDDERISTSPHVILEDLIEGTDEAWPHAQPRDATYEAFAKKARYHGSRMLTWEITPVS